MYVYGEMHTHRGGQLGDLVEAEVEPLQLVRLPKLLPIRGVDAILNPKTS